MNIAGYFAAILIGISLGLIGGGGSILTVPVLVYLFSIDAILATTYSLFVVGTTSVIGSLSYFKKGLVSIPTALSFGIPSMLSVFLTRSYIVPSIPTEIFTVGRFIVTKSMLLMILFAALMVAASYSMIKKNTQTEDANAGENKNYKMMVIQGLMVGLVTGLIGAGGGFLIIPALVNILKLPMKKAVGTSLFIIAINSLFGFFVSYHAVSIDWLFILIITSLAIAGILIGSSIATKIDGRKLKPAFGWFVLVMGIYILAKETILK